MSEEYTVIMFPEYEKLLKECERLRTELSTLVLEQDELRYIVCKNIETKYTLLFGGLEYKAYELECNMLRLRRKIELIQSKLNRQENVSLSQIEKILDKEFEIYQEQLNEQINKMNSALERSNKKVMTEEQTKEFKKLYRNIVKSLHPDLNPNATPSQIQLFQNAVQAYESGDMQALRVISEMVSEPKLPENGSDATALLIEEISRLENLVSIIRDGTEQIKSEYPYNLKPIIDSNEKIAERKKELLDRIDELTKLIEYYNLKTEGMMGKNE